MTDYEVELIDDESKFLALSDIWNELLSQNEINTFFLRFEWMKNWWQSFGADHSLFILIAREKNAQATSAKDKANVVGIAPLMRSKQKKIEFIGTGLADYADFIISSGKEEVLCAFVDYLFSHRSRWNEIGLLEIPRKSSSIDLLGSLLKKHTNTSIIRQTVPCASLDLQSSKSEEIDALLKKKDLRRHIKFFEQSGAFSFQKVENIDSALSLLELFFEQHISIWQRRDQPSMFLDKRYKEFFKNLTKDLLASKEVTIWSMHQDEKLVAMQFGFEYRGSYITYCQSYDLEFAKHSPATVLYKLFIEQYRKQGLAIVDFSRGSESYKSRFSNAKTVNMKVMVYKNPMKYHLLRLYYGFKKIAMAQKS